MRLVTKNYERECVHNSKERVQKALSAAESMMVELKIPRGKHLLFILGYPEAMDNRDAIKYWVLKQEPELAIDTASYPILRSKLQALLLDAVERYT